jgi:hypothetical protein
MTRRLDGEGAMSRKDGPGVPTVISATNRSLDRLDTLIDSGYELPSLMDLLSRARPVASRVAPQAINLTIDSSNDVT